ncbi:MAG: hypothetical protein V7731_03540 [Amphritea sp.]|jgi:hypothetical protein
MQQQQQQHHATAWPEAATDLFDLLTGRHAEVTYQLDDLEISIPMETGSEADHALWKLNGTIKVRAREDA